MCLRFLDAKLSRLSQVLDKPCSPRDRSAVAVHAYSSFLRHWVMTFRERVSQGNSQSQARNSVCALAAIVYVIPDALRRSCMRAGAGRTLVPSTGGCKKLVEDFNVQMTIKIKIASPPFLPPHQLYSRCYGRTLYSILRGNR